MITPRRIVLTLSMLAALTISAITRPELSLGLAYNRASEYSQNGIGVKLAVPVYDRFSLEAEMIYFGKRKGATTLDLNLHVRYQFNVYKRLSVYPFGGVSYTHWGYDGPNASRWGANLGGGAEVHFNRAWGFFAEARLQLVSHESQLIATLGIRHRF